jgi:hypothetical protein
LPSEREQRANNIIKRHVQEPRSNSLLRTVTHEQEVVGGAVSTTLRRALWVVALVGLLLTAAGTALGQDGAAAKFRSGPEVTVGADETVDDLYATAGTVVVDGRVTGDLRIGLMPTLTRAVLFPLRLTPLAPRLGLAARQSDPAAGSYRWYREHGRKVAVVIPTYGPPDLAIATIKSIRATTRRLRVRIVVADDGSASEHVARLEGVRGIELIRGERQLGFAGNANRGLRTVRPDEDAVLLNYDMIAHKRWLERLQYGAYLEPAAGIVGPKLLYPDGTIQSAGSIRNPGAPEWFDHAHRFSRHSVPQPIHGARPIPAVGASQNEKPPTIPKSKACRCRRACHSPAVSARLTLPSAITSR